VEDTTTSKPADTSKPAGSAAGTRAANIRRAEKNARKRAAREAARKAALRKQRQAMAGVVAAVIVVVVGIVLIVKFTSGSPRADSTASAANPSTTATAPTDAATSPTAAFPPVPAGSDPALKTKPAVKAGTGTLTKLDVKTLIQGTGATVKSGDTITVNYVGVTYADGKEFDSSWSRSEAFSTAIGQNAVIAGWDQGLVGVKVGSRVQLDIPQALAYPNASNGQPAGALRFVIDVLSDQPAS
jgi:peptidylprolyl isomerase